MRSHHHLMKSRIAVLSLVLLCLAGRAVMLPQAALAEEPEQPASADAPLAAPANDHFDNAHTLSGTLGSTAPFTNVEATAEPGEPNHAGVSMPLNSIWYRWTAAENVSLTIGTFGSGLNTAIAVYTGNTVNTLTLVAANDDIPNGYVSSVTFSARAGTAYHIAVDGVGAQTGTFGGIVWRINRAESSGQFNFDGDFASDFAVYHNATGTWQIRNSQLGDTTTLQWGLADDRLVPGAYDGTRTNIAVWRFNNGTFYKAAGLFGGVRSQQWGQPGDTPVQGDFDGDDRADYAIWRPANSTFYVLRSSNGSLLTQQWGDWQTDVVAPGDYDGDGRTDFAVFRHSGPNAGTFYILRSSDGSLLAQRWGLGPDLVVPGDYDGDGKNDIAVRRGSNNTYYILRSSDGTLMSVEWGTAGDDPAPGDYDGDGKTDISVYRRSNGTFYVRRSVNGQLMTQQMGGEGYRAVAHSNVH